MGTNDNPSTPTEALDRAGASTIAANPNASRSVLNQNEFFIRVLTAPQFISPHHASLLTHDHHIAPRGFDIDSSGKVVRHDGYDVRVAGGNEGQPRYTFMGRILRTTNGLRPHIYVRDPCTLTSAQVADTNYLNSLYNLHTQFISDESGGGVAVAVGDIVKATIGRSDFVGPQLQVAYFSSIISTDDQELYMEANQAECNTLLNLMGVSADQVASTTCTQGGVDFDVTGAGPRNAARRDAATNQLTRTTIAGAPNDTIYDEENIINFASTEGSFFHFFNLVLQRMGANYMTKTNIKRYQLAPKTIRDFHCGEAIKFLCAMMLFESNRATNNPISTTRNFSADPFITGFNSFDNGRACVKNYSTFEHGVNATVATLNASYYPTIQLYLKGRLTNSQGHRVITARVAFTIPEIASELATFGGGSGTHYADNCADVLSRRLEQAPTFSPGDPGTEDHEMKRGVNLHVVSYADRTRFALKAAGFTPTEVETYSGVCANTAAAATWRARCDMSFTDRATALMAGRSGPTLTGDALAASTMPLRQTRESKCLQHIGPNRGPIWDPLQSNDISYGDFASEVTNLGGATGDSLYLGYGRSLWRSDTVPQSGESDAAAEWTYLKQVVELRYRVTVAEGAFRPELYRDSVLGDDLDFNLYYARIPAHTIEEITSEGFISLAGARSDELSGWSYGTNRWRHYVGDWAPGAFVAVIENALSQRTASRASVTADKHHEAGIASSSFLSRSSRGGAGDSVTVDGAEFNEALVPGTTK